MEAQRFLKSSADAKIGPVSEQEVCRLILARQATAETPCWTSGMAEWTVIACSFAVMQRG